MSERTLYLLRHAKSASGDSWLADFDRPLDKRGAREAAWVAELFGARAIRPELVLCSPALRTRETLDPLVGRVGPVRFERRIYEASAAGLLGLIREQPAEPLSILLVGHNPGFEDLARSLASDGDAAALKRLRRKYPPAGLATIAFVTRTWAEVGPGSGRLVAFDAPED